MCPITALASQSQPVSISLVYEVSNALGLSADDGMAIVRAADNDDVCDQALRARILEAVGLSELAPAQLTMPWAPGSQVLANNALKT